MAIGLEAVTARKAKNKEIKTVDSHQPRPTRKVKVKFQLAEEYSIEENESWLSLTEICVGAPKESVILKLSLQWSYLEQLVAEAVHQRSVRSRLLTLRVGRPTDQK